MPDLIHLIVVTGCCASWRTAGTLRHEEELVFTRPPQCPVGPHECVRGNRVVRQRLAKLLQSVFGQQDAWEELLCEIHELTELTWNLLNGVQPTMDPLTLYEAILSVRTRWMSLRRAHFSHGNEDSQISVEAVSETGLMEEANLFERLMEYLKELVSLTPP